MPALRWLALHGTGIAAQLPALAALRIRVFRDWPYLYEGSFDYEQHYLQAYVSCPQSIVVLAFDGIELVGATTALPLLQAAAELREPFERLGLATGNTLYFGESVVLESHRGLGIGVQFFERREAHARALGLTQCSFCAVQRPEHHPARPPGYKGNESFWQKRGYERQPQLQGHFAWLDIGEAAATEKPMIYWTKTL